MCRHCDRLIEDKQTVHDFMAVAAKRLSEKHKRVLTADDLDITVSFTQPIYRYPVLEMMKEIEKEAAFLL